MAHSKTPGLIQRGSGIWHYDFLVDRIRYQGTTGTPDPKSAALYVSKLRLDIARGDLDIGLDRQNLLLEDIHAEYLASRQRHISQSYLASLGAHWRLWLAPALGKIPVDRVGALQVDLLRNALLDAGKSRTYANDVLITLRTLLNFAFKRGRLRKALKVELLRIQRKPRPTVPAARIADFLKAADAVSKNPQVRVMLRTLVALGLRESELLGMRWEWFDFERQTYTVGKAKGKEARVVPVPGWLWTAFQGVPKNLSEWVFPAEDGKVHRPGFLRKPLMKVAVDLGLGHLTQHRLRATFASLHAEAGTPITEIQGMLGHKAVTTTMIYVEQSLESKRRAQDQLSKILGLA